MASGALRSIGWLEQCLLDQHGAGGGWISRAVITAEPFSVDGLTDALAGLVEEFPILRIAPRRGEWIDTSEANVVIARQMSDATTAVTDHLNRIAEPTHDPLHMLTPIGSASDRCIGVVIGSSHALSDGVTMTALADRLAYDISGATRSDRRRRRFAASLEDIIGPRTRRQLAAAMFAQVRSGYLRAGLTTWAASRRVDEPHARSSVVTTLVTTQVPEADRYSVVRDACVRLSECPSRILTTVDVRQHVPGLRDHLGYLASGFVTRHTPGGDGRSRRASWEDPPTLHRYLSQLGRHSPTPAVDCAISMQALPDEAAPNARTTTTFGGASVHGFGIPLHVFVHGADRAVAITVIFDERGTSTGRALRTLNEIAASLAGNRLHRSEHP